VLICIGKKLAKAGLLDDPEDVMFSGTTSCAT